VNLIRVIQEKVSEAKIDYEKLVENILPRLKDVASGGAWRYPHPGGWKRC